MATAFVQYSTSTLDVNVPTGYNGFLFLEGYTGTAGTSNCYVQLYNNTTASAIDTYAIEVNGNGNVPFAFSYPLTAGDTDNYSTTGSTCSIQTSLWYYATIPESGGSGGGGSATTTVEFDNEPFVLFYGLVLAFFALWTVLKTVELIKTK